LKRIFLKLLWRNAREFFEGAVKGRFGIESAIERDGEQTRIIGGFEFFLDFRDAEWR